ncbi:3-oxoacyl-[acyl-carrier-protein] synthase III C-terminal domain-containing protein [Gordonia soli]|uniref:Beta-ketoacyl-[acyl-carrier-protein] synthase III C-terminal domain-containing protein n=1 Tax=Gordonia soli NBRC 108243 TaxID=1223545 RepID=M0QLC5_9ACTN|nr:3-oxoacyl-[acyl-carrier-protein] synthase III C-terminal domain-containing protein [Gordonia soli]GAC69348.1 hypothetical protein GS4_23_01450 [Gordonia soli NBRC 108243]
MRYADVYIDGLGVYLPRSRALTEAVSVGQLSSDEMNSWGWTGVAEAGDIAPADMAVAAGRAAIAMSSTDARTIGSVVHAAGSVQGSIMWPGHHYVQRHTIGDHGSAFELRQACSGGLAALGVAASTVSGRSEPTAVLVTGADNHYWYDRFEWVRHHLAAVRAMPLPGDAGHALVVNNSGGFARVDAVVSAAVPEFEEAFRLPGRPFPVPLSVPTVEEVHAITGAVAEHAQWLRALSFQMVRTALRTATAALDEAHVSPEDITWFLPGFSTTPTAATFITKHLQLEIPEDVDTFGRSTGHLSVSDHAAGLAYLATQGRLKVGDRILVGATGLAASLCYAVVTIVDEVPEVGLDRVERVG